MHAIPIWSNMGTECSMFLILNFFKKILPLNVAIMTLNAIMRYFDLMKIYTHDLFIKTQ